jgi:hypothetical protein
MPNELNKKGEYYQGYLMPEKFSRWLDSCPLNWQMVSIGKDRGTYMFFVEDDLDKDLVEMKINCGEYVENDK